jgi:hypothetical protein
MITQSHSEFRQPRTRRRLLMALLAVALLAVGGPATPIFGGPGPAFATQGSGGGGGP